MLSRLINSIFNPQSFWRCVFRYGFLDKQRAPEDWFNFRHQINRECAMRLNPIGGPPKKILEEIFPGISERTCRMKLIRSTAYNVSWEEMCAISQIVEALRPKRLFEFGTFDGRTTYHLAANAPDGAITYSLDIQTGEFNFSNDGVYFGKVRVGEHARDSALNSKISLLVGDSKNYDFSQFVGNIDVVFVDADHSYGGVKNDSEVAFKMLRPGGILIWHDYLLVGEVTRAIVDICKTKTLQNLKGTSLVIWKKE